MRIPIDRESDVPIYRQVQNYISEGILAGSLTADMQLPASRKTGQRFGD